MACLLECEHWGSSYPRTLYGWHAAATRSLVPVMLHSVCEVTNPGFLQVTAHPAANNTTAGMPSASKTHTTSECQLHHAMMAA